jgi:hypothetical protein
MLNINEPAALDQLDFYNARARAFLRRMLGFISGRDTELMAWDEVKDKLKLRGMVARGVQTVPIDKIVGSVGRYLDFDDAFLPRHKSLEQRWRSINRAFYADVSLPPVHLYKVGDVYFVLDGNHRISVARERGSVFIDAEVTEAVTRVSLTAKDIEADTLDILGEYAEFLERTQLDNLRPAQNIRLSIGGGYHRLIEHIAVHRYFMGLNLKRDVSEDEAVTDWYDNVYMPVITAVREEEVLHEFPGRTEADMYLWVIDHQHFLREECGCDITAEDAAADYTDHYAPRPPLKRVQDAIEQLVYGRSGERERG